jgi:tRNA pseudouridine(55) synthase
MWWREYADWRAPARSGTPGTLDPMATGVLVLGVNRATRLLGHLMLTEKAYDATIRLGVATTTDDAEGEIIGHGDTSALSEDARARGLRRLRRRHRPGAYGRVGDQGRRQAGLSART